MNVYQELIFSYLEEDNTQRAYFRVKPLLATSGDIRQEAQAAWADEGALRIVPDRAEQYHFKDRMRTLGSYCVMDLTHTTEEANKIRTNKNYNPAKGERNQYILFSDAVQPLPNHSFFHVLDGTAEQASELAKQAITPLFYLRDGDTLYGPVNRDQVKEVTPAAPAEGTLYTLECPDGVTRTLFCLPQAAPASEAAAHAEAKEEPLAIGCKLHILDESKDFDAQLSDIAQPLSAGANLLAAPAHRPVAPRPVPSAQLSGTPLMRSSFRAATPKPKNQLQEVVSAQWRAARYEPPAASLPAGATLHPVENPVEEACRCLTQAWKLPEAQQQLLDHVLSLPGMGQRLTALRVGENASGETPLQAVLTARLQDLEAERLSALVELDKAKADLEQFRKTQLEQLRTQKAQDLEALEREENARRASAEALQQQLTALTAQRDALQAQVDHLQQEELPQTLAEAMAKAQLTAPMSGTPLRLCPVPGETVTPEALLQRLIQGLNDAGCPLAQEDAVTLLTLLACFPRFGVICPQFAPAVEFLHTCFASCGWSSGLKVQENADQHPVLSTPPAGATPAAVISPLLLPALEQPLHTILLGKNAAYFCRSSAWEMSPWPLWYLPQLPVYDGTKIACVLPPISAATLDAFAAQSGATEAEVDGCLQPIVTALEPVGILTGGMLADMKRFIRVASALMSGGLAPAMDRGLALWLGAVAQGSNRISALLGSLVGEYPLTASLLRK